MEIDRSQCPQITARLVSQNGPVDSEVILRLLVKGKPKADLVVFGANQESSATPVDLNIAGLKAMCTDKPAALFTPAPAVPAAPSACSTSYVFTSALRAGGDVAQVEELQELLQCLGFFPKTQAVTDDYGPLTVQAVKSFQKSVGLPTTGTVGPRTRAALKQYYRKGSETR
jgi:peptidoglycan hydrolase-like protein with peptidoglycan-binding domain